jgi:undecaprenyl phosphate N,N'-diacetylbacillosamine 1-phosphate transferase
VRGFYRAVKRFLDVTASFLGLVLLSPLMLAVSILIKIDSRGPVIFRQKRIGRNGKVFEIYKFRSMCVGAEKTGSGVYSGKGDTRVTRIGKILRTTSIDELPQLLNILKGEMSFVGPRPPLTYHPWKYEEYTDSQKRMFEVRPGITGWAQVNGRKDVEWHKRIELNVWYVDHMSLLLDIKIMFMTAFKVLTNADNENSGATVNKSTEPSNDAKVVKK